MKLRFGIGFRGRQKAQSNNATMNNTGYNYLPGMPLLTKKLRAFREPLNEGLVVGKRNRTRIYNSITREYWVYFDNEKIGKFSVKQRGLVIGNMAFGRVRRSYDGMVPSSGPKDAVIETNGLLLWDGLRILIEKARVSASSIATSFMESKTRLTKSKVI